MIDLRAEIAERHLRFMALAAGGIGLRCCLPGLAPVWPWLAGLNLLLRWEGPRLPLPDLADPDGRQPAIAGLALAGVTEILTFADLPLAADTVYHVGLIQVSGGGVPNSLRPLEIVTRTIDGAGAVRGLMPNAPAALQAEVLADNTPRVSWAYSAAAQQTAPASFGVYASSDGAFDFDEPAGSVLYERGRSRYAWTGAPLPADAQRWYSVRARSAAGVLSLIPRADVCPSADYDSVDAGHCPLVHVPESAPPPIDELWAEVAP